MPKLRYAIARTVCEEYTFDISNICELIASPDKDLFLTRGGCVGHAAGADCRAERQLRRPGLLP